MPRAKLGSTACAAGMKETKDFRQGRPKNNSPRPHRDRIARDPFHGKAPAGAGSDRAVHGARWTAGAARQALRAGAAENPRDNL